MHSQARLDQDFLDLSFTATPGALAWIPFPFPPSHLKTATNSHKWPAILFPSWSTAIKSSGFFPKFVNRSAQTAIASDDVDVDIDIDCSNGKSALRLMGCKKEVRLKDLSANMVPVKVALGPRKGDSRRREKVCARFLGFPPGEARWGAVDPQEALPYTEKICKEILLGKNSGVCVKNGVLLRSQELLEAMNEGSVALEQPNLHPSSLFPKLSTVVVAEEEDKGDTLLGRAPVKYDGETPEFYDDWREGGYTQTESQSQSQFSMGFGSSDARKNKYHSISSSYDANTVKRRDECDNPPGRTVTVRWDDTDSRNNKADQADRSLIEVGKFDNISPFLKSYTGKTQDPLQLGNNGAEVKEPMEKCPPTCCESPSGGHLIEGMGVKRNIECVISSTGQRDSQKNEDNSMKKVRLIPDGQGLSSPVEVTDSHDDNDGEESGDHKKEYSQESYNMSLNTQE